MIHKARYYQPGAFFSEDTTLVLSARSVEEAVSKAPRGAFCFTLFDTADPVDLGPDYTVIPKPQNESGKYYLDGEVLTYEQVELLDAAPDEDYSTLLFNMRVNGWPRVIRCGTLNWQPFDDGDTLIDRADIASR